MKKKIITIGVSMLFILTALTSVEAVDTKDTTNKNANEEPTEFKTITFHVFEDKDMDGLQDSGENNAYNAKVYVAGSTFSILRAKTTNKDGNVCLKIPKNVDVQVDACTGSYWLQSNTWKGRIWVSSSTNENEIAPIPLHYYKRDSCSKNVGVNIFTFIERIFENHPLLLRLQK